MGIFVNALCEEAEFLDNTGFDAGAVADPDDKYAIELQDVAKAVEDINQNYADQSSEEELDGQDLEEDPVSECMIAIYESEHNWNQIMNALASREVLEAARGRDMVMESVDIKGFFTKVKEFFVKMWKKITTVVKQWLANASAVLRTNKSFASKYGSKLAEGKAAYFADPKSKNFKGYKFDGSMDKETTSNLFKGMTAAAEYEKSVNTLINNIKGGSKDFSDIDKMAKGYNPDVTRSAFCGNKEATSDNFRKMLKAAYFGSEEKVTLNKDDRALNPEFIKSVLSSDMKMSDVKKGYNEMKKSLNGIIKSLNELEKAVRGSYEKGEADSNSSAAISAISKWSSNVKECKNIAHMGLTMFMKASHAQAAQCRHIGNAYIFALNKGKRKNAWDAADGKKVAHEGGFLSNIEMI